MGIEPKGFLLDPQTILELRVKDYANTLKVKAVGEQFGDILQDLVTLDENVKKLRAGQSNLNIEEVETQVSDLVQKIGKLTGNLDITSLDIADEANTLGLG